MAQQEHNNHVKSILLMTKGEISNILCNIYGLTVASKKNNNNDQSEPDQNQNVNNENAINNNNQDSNDIIDQELADIYNVQFTDVKYSNTESPKEWKLYLINKRICFNDIVRNVLMKKEQYFCVLIQMEKHDRIEIEH